MKRFWTRTAALIAVLVVAAVAIGATSGAAAGPEPPVPLRVYVIVLDGLMPHEIRPETAPNLSELRAEGTWYEEARAVFPAETIPNHVAMMTGVLPQRSGIIGNDYWAPNSNNSRASRMAHPKLLGADTLTTRLESRCDVSTATVQSKGYLWGVFRGEPIPDGERTPANFADLPGDENFDHPGQQRQADFHWKPYESPAYIPDPDDHIVDQVTMGEGFMPWIESDSPTPQFAFVNLGDIDRSGHVDESGLAAGISAFRQVAIADTDTLIGEMVSQLESTGAWDETVLIFTSDHGMDWSVSDDGPNRFESATSLNVSAELQAAGYTRDGTGTPGPNVTADPNTKGDFQPVPGGGTAAVYVEEDEDLVPIAEILAAHPGVAFVATRERIPGLANNPTLSEMGMDHRNNGDIVVGMKKGWAVRDSISANPLPGNHGHPATQHSTLMVTGGHPVLDDTPESVPGEKVFDPENKIFSPPAEGPGNLSVAPTVAALFGIGEPAGGYARGPLTEAFDEWAFQPHEPCSAAAPLPGQQDEEEERQTPTDEDVDGAGPGPSATPVVPSGPPSSSTAAGASSRESALRSTTLAAATALRRAGLRRLLRRGLVSFRAVAPGAGTLVLDVRARTIRVARGARRFQRAGAATMTLRLTRAGRRFLRRSRTASLVVRARFGASPVSSRRVTVLR